MVDFDTVLRRCELCPRRCGANRLAGEAGACGARNKPEVYAFFPHHGEEPAISGRGGSGAVFFCRCPLSCIYCQNYPWSQEGRGTSYDTAGLARIFRKLRRDRCDNLNLVSPTPWLPWIIEALEIEQAGAKRLPVVFNSSGYERVETLNRLEGKVDIYLVDLRYSSDETARAASGVGDYVATARAAFTEMWRQAGPLRLDSNGIALAGLVCRLLILPGREREAMENIEWIADSFGTEACLSVMSQYMPAYKAVKSPSWDRTITRKEYETVCAEIARLGFYRGWIQDFGGCGNEEFMGFNMTPSPAPRFSVSIGTK